MSDRTGIEWTEATWNPVTGCSKVSPGCAHCYAERIELRFGRSVLPWTPENAAENVRLHPERLDQPLRWRRPRMVFVNSMSDLFHEEVPDEFIDRVFGVMWRAERHTFQVLTKRPERALTYLSRVVYVSDPRDRSDVVGPARLPDVWPLPNVWLGVSIENARYTWRASVLRQIPAAVRFISAEPLLGSLFDGGPPMPTVEPAMWRQTPRRAPLDLTGMDWLIVGGESGPHARPMHPDWVRELRDACSPRILDYETTSPEDRAAAEERHVAFFFKQWGEYAPYEWRVGDRAADRLHCFPSGNRNTYVRRVGKKAAGRLLDGREWNEMPPRRLVPA